MATIADGKTISETLLNKLKTKIIKLDLKPHLAVVLVGSDAASATYVRKKQEAALQIGVKFSLYKFPESISTKDLISELQKIQTPASPRTRLDPIESEQAASRGGQPLSGIIVQLPLSAAINKQLVLNELDPLLDVDFLSWESLGKLVIGENQLIPPSPGAVLEILNHYKVDLRGKHVVLVGAGDLIGKPLANLLIQMPVTLTVCNKDTKNLPEITREADILITGVGRAELISATMVKKGVVAIDAGVSFKGKKMFGDLNFNEVSKVASLITPTPGGVGPITVAKLLENVVLNEIQKSNV